MTKEQYKYKFKDYLSKYPLGKVGRLSLEEEYAKISVVAYVIARDLGIEWGSVVSTMCAIRGFTGTKIPNVLIAAHQLRLRSGFLDDWNSIQYLKENNAPIMQGMELLIRQYSTEVNMT